MFVKHAKDKKMGDFVTAVVGKGYSPSHFKQLNGLKK